MKAADAGSLATAYDRGTWGIRKHGKNDGGTAGTAMIGH